MARETREGKIKHIGLLMLYKVLPECSLQDKIYACMSQKMSTKVILLFNMTWEQACHRLINLKYIFNLRKLRKLNVFTQSLIWNNMLETGTVSSCLTFDLKSSKLEIELQIRTLLIWSVTRRE